METETMGFRRNAQQEALMGGMRVADAVSQANVTTPAYVYDVGAMAQIAAEAMAAFGTQRGFIAYAVKANSAGTVIRAITGQGAGADVVSGGELELALACQVPRERIVMSGVAKSDDEIERAIGRGILALQVESVEELARVSARAQALGVPARVSLRVNPNVRFETHSHIATGHDAAKFGIAVNDIPAAFEVIDRHAATLKAVGISTHVGSMLSTPEPYLEAARVVCEIAKARQEKAGPLTFCDFGGGFGINYGSGTYAPIGDYIRAACGLLKEYALDVQLIAEPGRSLVGANGVLVAQVLSEKHASGRRWLMINAGMNDLIRPALYGAHHRVEPLTGGTGTVEWKVVGPVCESSDDFGQHLLGEQAPSHVVIRDAGAYGYVMASQYNARALPAEIFVRAGRIVSVSPAEDPAEWVKRRARA
ncbi:MAG: diaminopimelate decarboxylase [Polyangiaceae bacterium]|nr:diaminopimelate decarboxylase [Polyangiaceae bacterium]